MKKKLILGVAKTASVNHQMDDKNRRIFQLGMAQKY